MWKNELICVDPPLHTGTRKLIIDRLGPRQIGGVQQTIHQCAQSRADRIAAMAEFDAATDVALDLIDFVAAPNLIDAAWERWEIQVRPGHVEMAAEVIAKKMVHRGDRATARDLFDPAMVVEREPDALAAAGPFLTGHLDRFLEQIGQPGAGFVTTFEAIAATWYRPCLAHCVELATAYLSALKDR